MTKEQFETHSFNKSDKILYSGMVWTLALVDFDCQFFTLKQFYKLEGQDVEYVRYKDAFYEECEIYNEQTMAIEPTEQIDAYSK